MSTARDQPTEPSDEGKAPETEVSVHLHRNLESFDQRALDEANVFRWEARKVARIAGLLSGITPKDVGADVGCGTGLAGLEYLRAGVQRLDGFDVSSECLRRATARGINAVYWNADGTRCPAADASYDVVVAGDIIEHLLDTETFTDELRRILRPHGTLILTTPNLASWFSRVRLLVGRVPTSSPGVSSNFRRDPFFVDTNHLRISVLSEWSAFFEARGFVIERVLGWSQIQAWEGSRRVSVYKVLGRLFERRPALAENLIFLLRPELT